MNKSKLFLKLIHSDIKRTKKYLPAVLLSVAILLSICTASAIVISKHVYSKGNFTTVKLAYYLPEDGDTKVTTMAINMMEDMKSMQETAVLIQVDSPEEGYRMVEDEEVLYFINVPENFFSGVMDSTNPKLEIIIKDHSTITAYIANELFISYADYLGITQASIYSLLDTIRAHDYSEETEDHLTDIVNLTFLDRALNKDVYMDTVSVTEQGEFSLIEGYLSSAVLISLLFIAIVIMPLMMGHSKGITLTLSINKISNFHIYISNVISAFITVYIAYIPCAIVMSIACKTFNPVGFIQIIPYLIAIAAIIALAALLGGNNYFTGNMIALVLALGIVYIGGGILPRQMLPSIIQDISNILPGKYLISGIAGCIFG